MTSSAAVAAPVDPFEAVDPTTPPATSSSTTGATDPFEAVDPTPPPPTTLKGVAQGAGSGLLQGAIDLPSNLTTDTERNIVELGKAAAGSAYLAGSSETNLPDGYTLTAGGKAALSPDGKMYRFIDPANGQDTMRAVTSKVPIPDGAKPPSVTTHADLPGFLQPETQEQKNADVGTSDWLNTQVRNAGGSKLIDATENSTGARYAHSAFSAVPGALVGNEGTALVKAGVSGLAAGAASQRAEDIGAGSLSPVAGIVAGVLTHGAIRGRPGVTPEDLINHNAPPAAPEGGYTADELLGSGEGTLPGGSSAPEPAPAVPKSGDLMDPTPPPAKPADGRPQITHEIDEDSGQHVVSSPNGQSIAQEDGTYLRVQRDDTAPEAQGKGEGTARWTSLGQEADSRGLTLASDVSVSPAEAATMARYAARTGGQEVQANNPIVNPDTGNFISQDPRTPAFELKPEPAAPLAPSDAKHLADPGVGGGVNLAHPQAFTGLSAAKSDLSPDQNAQRSDQLRTDLQSLGAPYSPTLGNYMGSREPSFMVASGDPATRPALEALAQKYGQESVMHVEPDGSAGFKYMADGHTEPMGQWTQIDHATARTADGWTRGPNKSYFGLQPKAEAPAATGEVSTRPLSEMFPGQRGGPKAPKVAAPISPAEARVRASLSPEEQAQLNRGDVAQRVVDAFHNAPKTEELAAAALAGKAKKGWYDDAANSIHDVFQGDAPRFSALLAAMSPQTSVEMNFHNALRTFINWDKAGRPTDAASIHNIMGDSVLGSKKGDSVLDAWKNNSVRALAHPAPDTLTLSGPKVDSFMGNLQKKVNAVTLDSWMAKFADLDAAKFGGSLTKGGGPGKSATYLGYSAKVREAAKMLTEKTGEKWTPAEVQETVWSWAKTASEHADSYKGMATIPELVRGKEITDEHIRGTSDFHSLFSEPGHANALANSRFSDNAARASGAARTSLAAAATGSEAESSLRQALEPHLQSAAERLEGVRTRGESEPAPAAPKRRLAEMLPNQRGGPKFEPDDIAPHPLAGDKEAGKQRVAELKAKMAAVAAKGGLTGEESLQFRADHSELQSLLYDRGKPGTPDKVLPAAQRKSALSPEANSAITQDVRRSKAIFMPLMEATAGTYDNRDTPVDDIFNGKNPRVSPQVMYDNFASTRAALRAQYGDTVPLYRATGLQKEKATTNWATTKAFAAQFGPKVIERNVPVDNILAANANNTGTYHELVVGDPGKLRLQTGNEASLTSPQAGSRLADLLPNQRGGPKFTPPKPGASGVQFPPPPEAANEHAPGVERPKQQQALAADTLRAVGLNETRQSAITGNWRETGNDWQTAKLKNTAGNRMAEVLANERGALHDYAKDIVNKSGGTAGLDRESNLTRGRTIAAAPNAYNDALDQQTNRVYEDVKAKIGTKSVPTPGLQKLVESQEHEFTGKVGGAQLLVGLKSALKNMGITDKSGKFQNVPINNLEELRKWAGEQYDHTTAKLIGKIKDTITDDVTAAAGKDVFAQGRALRALRSKNIEEPTGVSSILDPPDRLGINREVPYEDVPAKVTGLPVEQFNHFVQVLKDMAKGNRDLAQKSADAMNELRAQFANKVLDIGDKNAEAWDTKGVSKYLNDNLARMKAVFRDDEIQRFKTLNAAGGYLHLDRRYPGAAAQAHNYWVDQVLSKGGAALTVGGAHVGGLAGAAIGHGASKLMDKGAEALLERAVNKRIVKL